MGSEYNVLPYDIQLLNQMENRIYQRGKGRAVNGFLVLGFLYHGEL